MGFYEFRRGDGNEGTFYQATIKARNMEHAIRKARRSHIFLKPYWRRKLVVEGDDSHTSLAIYPTKTWSAFGMCPYVFDIIHVSKEDASYNLSFYGR